MNKIASKLFMKYLKDLSLIHFSKTFTVSQTISINTLKIVCDISTNKIYNNYNNYFPIN